jgi:hypothetical protein
MESLVAFLKRNLSKTTDTKVSDFLEINRNSNIFHILASIGTYKCIEHSENKEKFEKLIKSSPEKMGMQISYIIDGFREKVDNCIRTLNKLFTECLMMICNSDKQCELFNEVEKLIPLLNNKSTRIFAEKPFFGKKELKKRHFEVSTKMVNGVEFSEDHFIIYYNKSGNKDKEEQSLDNVLDYSMNFGLSEHVFSFLTLLQSFEEIYKDVLNGKINPDGKYPPGKEPRSLVFLKEKYDNLIIKYINKIGAKNSPENIQKAGIEIFPAIYSLNRPRVSSSNPRVSPRTPRMSPRMSLRASPRHTRVISRVRPFPLRVSPPMSPPMYRPRDPTRMGSRYDDLIVVYSTLSNMFDEACAKLCRFSFWKNTCKRSSCLNFDNYLIRFHLQVLTRISGNSTQSEKLVKNLLDDCQNDERKMNQLLNFFEDLYFKYEKRGLSEFQKEIKILKQYELSRGKLRKETHKNKLNPKRNRIKNGSKKGTRHI